MSVPVASCDCVRSSGACAASAECDCDDCVVVFTAYRVAWQFVQLLFVQFLLVGCVTAMSLPTQQHNASRHCMVRCLDLVTPRPRMVRSMLRCFYSTA
jgi:hypothetical protein